MRGWPRCAMYERLASNYPGSCCATVITTTDIPGRCCIGAGWQISSSTSHYIILYCKIASQRWKHPSNGATVWKLASSRLCREWSLAPLVESLQALRGIALVSAATLVAELGDIARFGNPRQLMAYLGLVPSEHSSGRSRRQGGITKAGNAAARRMLS